MILIHEAMSKESELKSFQEAGIILRDILQVLLLITLAHFTVHGAVLNNILLSLIFSPFLGLFLVAGYRVKRGTYLFVPLMIVIAIVLEIEVSAPAVFTVIFAGVWERLLVRQSVSHRVVDIGKILYPFIYVYTGELIIPFAFTTYLLGAGILLFKAVGEYIAITLKKGKMPLHQLSFRIPMAGLSLHHLLFLKDTFPIHLFSIVTVAFVTSEFLAPMLAFVSKNIYKKV